MDTFWWVLALVLLAGVPHRDPDQLAILPELALIGLLGGVLHVSVGLWLRVYQVGHERGSFDEVATLIRAAMVAGLLLALVIAVSGDHTPLLGVAGSAVALAFMLGPRLSVRIERHRRASARSRGTHTIILGAGAGGRHLLNSMLSHDEHHRPVAFLDDDPAKRRLRINGVPVLGDRTDLQAVATSTGATHLAVAIPSIRSEDLREVRQLAHTAGLKMLVLPRLDALLGAEPGLQDLRDLDLEDLLGRRPVTLDQGAISDQIQGKVVLVTGAGGSIGSELCRQITRHGPARIVMLDRDESALHATQLSITGRGLLEGEDLVLLDIRDRERLTEAFARARPDVVFHAAALKHLTLLQKHPHEAWLTNVLGTRNVLEAAARAGVGTLVNISTDKAADPTCVLGLSKRLAERLTAAWSQREPGRYVSVRFGNVLGSRGSVIPAFTEQIRRGGPVTVTHPDVERFFMTIPEACQLVLQSAALGSDGDVIVLDMGKPVRIDDVARTLINLSGRRDVDITYTGLRPGEKLTESLVGRDEEHLPTDHPLLARVRVEPLDPIWLEAGPWQIGEPLPTPVPQPHGIPTPPAPAPRSLQSTRIEA
ncbi:polysaccharide biosynthesis protein [Ornithinimicrobium cryptoxanthini]|uniref:polysaccharide biosynthesis protein n=1 Tax=Ornithinimicrobium cryptoxanthini TaxID=2934161 RepID=UPI0021175C7B|nr:nucleoside-diphosphate sugar epimerase/dehydratase [Ornithinimicrobium cryptoxanthini]